MNPQPSYYRIVSLIIKHNNKKIQKTMAENDDQHDLTRQSVFAKTE